MVVFIKCASFYNDTKHGEVRCIMYNNEDIVRKTVTVQLYL